MIRACHPGSTSTTVCGSTSTAGPASRAPGAIASRRTNRASRQPPPSQTGATSAASGSPPTSATSGSATSAAPPTASAPAASITSGASPGSKPNRARCAAANAARIAASDPNGTSSAVSVPFTFRNSDARSRTSAAGTPCASTSAAQSTPSASISAAASSRLARESSASTACVRTARMSASPMP